MTGAISFNLNLLTEIIPSEICQRDFFVTLLNFSQVASILRLRGFISLSRPREKKLNRTEYYFFALILQTLSATERATMNGSVQPFFIYDYLI